MRIHARIIFFRLFHVGAIGIGLKKLTIKDILNVRLYLFKIPTASRSNLHIFTNEILYG